MEFNNISLDIIIHKIFSNIRDNKDYIRNDK